MVASLPRSQQKNQQVLGWNHSSHPFQHTDKTEWRNQAGLRLSKICNQILLVCFSYTVYSHGDQSMLPWIHLCWLVALASILKGIIHLIYWWVVSSSQNCLPFQDLNCQPDENFALFNQIGFVIIMMILFCCGCLDFPRRPIHWSSWEVHITTNQKDCDKCFQRIGINGKTMISLGDWISDWFLTDKFHNIISKKLLK